MINHRLAGADLIRALACVMVVGSHVAQRVAPTALPDWGKTTQAAWMMGAYGVGAFFVLSGYLLARPFWSALDAGQPMPSLKIYALRRAARILPGYYLALTVSFFLSFTLLRFPFDPSLVVRYGAGLLLLADVHWLTWFPVEFNGPLWSIGCEVTSYALLPVGLSLVFAMPMLRGWRARIAWAALVGAVVGLQILVVQHLQPDSFQRSWEFGLVGGAKVWMPNFSPVGFFAVFALGALGAGIQVRLAHLRSLWFDLLALAGLAVAVGAMAARFPDVDGFGVANIPYAFPWFPVGVGLMLCTIPSAVLLPHLTETVPIAFLARISFGIYVWHFLLMESVRVLWVPNFGYWGMTSVSLWAMVSAAVVVAAIVVATFSYYRFEAPVLSWARRLERRPDGPAATLSPATTG